MRNKRYKHIGINAMEIIIIIIIISKYIIKQNYTFKKQE